MCYVAVFFFCAVVFMYGFLAETDLSWFVSSLYNPEIIEYFLKCPCSFLNLNKETHVALSDWITLTVFSAGR